MSIIIFIIVLAVLIFVHELGHFLAARAFGIRVDEFALGFGPRLWSTTHHDKKHGTTRYALNLIPFGGYVKIFGENIDEASTTGPDAVRSFVNKPRYAQAIVLAAGVFFNFVFAALIFSVLFMTGLPASVDSYPEYTSRISDQRVVVTYVAPDSPAALAGIIAGDEIASIMLATTTTQAVRAEVVTSVIYGSAGQPVQISLVHDGRSEVKTVNPTTGIVPDKFAIGVGLSDGGTLKLPIHLAIYEGVRYTIHIITQTAFGIYDLIYQSLVGRGSLTAVSGPIGIAGLVGDALHLGATYVFVFTAMISVNLGVLNLVPFPALDGGRILFVAIEAITRRRMKPAFANAANTIGFLLLIILMVVVTWHDIMVKFF